jgi:hypothetical protein
MRRFARISVALALLVPSVGAAQRAGVPLESLRAGDRVRVAGRLLEPGGVVHGRLVALQADTLVFTPALSGGAAGRRQDVRLPLSDVRSLEVRRGSGRSAAGAVGGGALGLPLGAAAGIMAAVALCKSGACNPEGYAGSTGLAGALIGGAIGLVAGARLGAGPSGRWVPVPLPAGAGAPP